MKQTKHVFEIGGLLKWLTKSVLVLGLTIFSGYVSEAGIFNSEPTKTELSELRHTGSKKTINLKKAFNGLYGSLFPSINRTQHSIPFLRYQKNRTAVKFKNNFETLPINEQYGFLIFHSTKPAEEFNSKHIPG